MASSSPLLSFSSWSACDSPSPLSSPSTSPSPTTTSWDNVSAAPSKPFMLIVVGVGERALLVRPVNVLFLPRGIDFFCFSGEGGKELTEFGLYFIGEKGIGTSFGGCIEVDNDIDICD